MRETSERAAQVVGKAKGEGGSFDIDLPGAVRGKVVTRFPPEPSGYLHVGHAKAALLNDILAKIYEGKLVVRFDDTNPSKEKDEFVDNIMKDIDLLGLSYDRVTYTSDYFPQLLDLAERMIKAGHLYADDTPVDKMREERLAKKASSCRGRTGELGPRQPAAEERPMLCATVSGPGSRLHRRRARSGEEAGTVPAVEENLRLWEEMKKGSPEGVANCIRVKMDPADNNGCLRDPVCFRCNIENPHHRTGTKVTKATPCRRWHRQS